MSEARNITLERVNRLTQAMADLTESHAAQGRMMMRLLNQMNERLVSIDAAAIELRNGMRDLTSEQVLLGNRIEEAFARALRANIRLDEREDSADDQR